MSEQNTTDEHFLTAHVSRDGRVVGIEHPTDAAWSDVLAAHIALRDRLNKRLEAQRLCPYRPVMTDPLQQSTPEMDAEAIRMLRDGKAPSDVAAHFDLSVSLIYQRMRGPWAQALVEGAGK